MQYLVDGKPVSKEDFDRGLARESLKQFAYDSQGQLFPDPTVEEARALLRNKFDSGEPISIPVIDLGKGSIVVDGQRIPEQQFYEELARQQIRQFAYDPQGQLFPDEQIERVRAQTRERLDSGENIEVILKSAPSE